ncbi:MAG TPA: hypothetical protein VFL83_00925 [Anaeromyxobacter sp.]|nr:hypothetical protein [Anaeromyxobacter sp.]
MIAEPTPAAPVAAAAPSPRRPWPARAAAWLPALPAVALLGAIALALTTAVVDHDFWWHLASGRWMWEHGGLLDRDPFGAALDFGEGTRRVDFVLKQFWLAQLLFHGVVSAAGLHGVIVLRALVLGAMFALAWRRLRRLGAPAPLAALLLGAAAHVIVVEVAYVADRPQLFTSLGLVALLELLDRAFEGRRWARWALPALMVAWANLHAGFIVGAGVAAVHALARLRSVREQPRAFLAVGAALLAGGLNPCGFEAAFQAFGTSAGSQSPYWREIVEWQSLLDHASLAGIARRLPALAALSVAGAAGLALHLARPRAIRPERVAIALVAAAMGARAIRFIPFFAIVAAEVAALGIGPWAGRLAAPAVARFRRAAAAASAAAVLAVAAHFALMGARTTALGDEAPYDASLEPVARFVRSSGLRGTVFNDHNDGGFLDHAIAPDVRVFIDGRALSIRAYELYRQAVDAPEMPAPFAPGIPMYRALLALAGADLVLLPGADPASGTLVRMTEVLLRDPEWAVVFADERIVLFARRAGPLGAFAAARARPAAAGYENMLAMATRAARGGHGHGMSAWKLPAAVALVRMGNAAAGGPLLLEYARTHPRDPLVARLQLELRRGAAP